MIERSRSSSRSRTAFTSSRSPSASVASPATQGMEIGHLHLDRTATSTSCLVEAGVHGQAVQPRLETVRITKAPEIPPGAEQGVLDRVARELRVPDDEAGRRVQPRDRALDELGEGVMIAPPRAFDELSLVHGSLAVGQSP